MKQWFSAQELAGVAGLPTTFQGVLFKTTREGWQSRPRQGQGGGKEYAYASLPTGVQAALALRWWAAEVEDDKGVMQKAKEGASSHIQHAWASYALLKTPSKAKAQHLMLPALESLRSIYDTTECGLVLMGNEAVYSRLSGRRSAANLHAFASKWRGH